MAKNDFKAFATDRNANVMSQEEWEALPALLSGFTAGKASSAQVNKVIRQASFIAAALAQYTANKSGLDVLDDGDLNGFISKMGTAFGKDFQALDATLTALAGLETGANKLPYFTGNDTAAQTDLTSVGRDIIGKNTIADILTYLNLGDLGTASGRNVGNTQSFEIPDMSYFQLTGKGSDNLLAKLPNGLIIQVFRRRLANSTSIGMPTTIPVPYPTPFPTNIWGVFCTKATYAQIVTSCESATTTGFDAVTCLASGTSPGSNLSDVYFLAIGY
ncbi:TPA: phage tail protein [Escherichia coli]|nr:phage tail protein [Escherichia coli]